MDKKAITQALEVHPYIIAAGVCSSPAATEDKESDMDIFVYCSGIPPENERAALVSHLSSDYTPGRELTRWGVCDLAYMNGEEVWLMYVTEQETIDEAEQTLEGSLPDKLDNYYYPVGRLATLKDIGVLFDKTGFLGGLKARLAVYPERLSRALVKFHSEALLDTEDLERAAARGDALFYHFALDISIEHFLQALFALNRVYFPSRKRSIQYINGFAIQPQACAQTLLDIVRLGGAPGGLRASLGMMTGLIDWTRKQAEVV